MSGAVEKLLTQLDGSRERLLIIIEPLPDLILIKKGVVGKWSIADILVNLTVWEAELVTGLMKIERGQKPGRLLDALRDPKKYNQQRYSENQNRDLDLIFNDLVKVRVELEEWLEMFSEKKLTNKKQYSWLKGRSLRDLITQCTVENEQRYLPAVEDYVKAWQASMASNVIPLTAVSDPEDSS